MSLLHRGARRRTTLLALGALDGAERGRAEAHVASCPACARDLAATRAALDLASADGVRAAELPIPIGALVTRVRACLGEERAPHRGRPVFITLAALAAVVVLALVSRSLFFGVPGGDRAPRIATTSPLAAPPSGEERPTLPADALARLENALERERAARYLSDAQDVLVTVASSPQRCRRRGDAVEVGPEAERSRELLARRRLSVETDGGATVVARDVLDDVEEMLRQVAALDPCARPADLEAIRGEITRRRLLMKIDLVTRELQG